VGLLQFLYRLLYKAAGPTGSVCQQRQKNGQQGQIHADNLELLSRAYLFAFVRICCGCDDPRNFFDHRRTPLYPAVLLLPFGFAVHLVHQYFPPT